MKMHVAGKYPSHVLNVLRPELSTYIMKFEKNHFINASRP